MNKEQIASQVADKMGVTKKEASEYIDAFLDIVAEQLVQGESVSLVNFGKFDVKMRKERKGRNPQTREEMIIPAQRALSFSAGKGLKDRVKNA